MIAYGIGVNTNLERLALNLLLLIPLILLAHSEAKAEAKEVTSVTSKYIDAWGLALVEYYSGKPESDTGDYDLAIVHKNGVSRYIAKDLQGIFIPLPQARKVFACENNDIMETRGPKIVDLTGKVVQLKKHEGYLRTCEKVGSTEYVLLIYNYYKELEPSKFQRDFGLKNLQLTGLARIYSADGQLVYGNEFTTQTEIEIPLGRISQKILLPTPEPPG